MNFYQTKKIFIKIILIYFLIFVNFSYTKENDYIIRHAGGSIDGKIYTNSLEAFQKSIKEGYNYIELDLQISSDNKIVFTHDWSVFANQTNSNNFGPINYEEYLTKKIFNKYSTISHNKINQLMEENTDLFIITDKINDYKLLEETFSNIDRVIIEIFGAKNYFQSFFYKKITDKNRLFSTHLSFKHKSFITALNIKQIAIPCSIVNKNISFLKKYIKKGKDVFCYTLNEKKEFDYLIRNKLVTKIYSDFL